MTTIHVAEYTDEQGPYCNVWTDDSDGATYDNLEAAAWNIGFCKPIEIIVHGDDNELARFNKARREAVSYYMQQERIARAPRDKATGRPLFVSY